MSYKRIYDDKWNFRDGSMKEYVHGLHPYPAMMMPLIARTIFDEYSISKNSKFLDPYVGSGTTIVESQIRGIGEATGIDLNPLALLLSKTKTNNYDIVLLEKSISEFDDYLSSNPKYEVPNFPLRDSWFKERNVDELALIRHFIFRFNGVYLDFFKTCFSEVVRDVSLTRNGEFKLYRIPKNRINSFNPNAIDKFIQVMYRNLNYLKTYVNEIPHETKLNFIENSTERVLYSKNYSNYFDIVVTSPPYGDSHTTVAYGQFSRLANEWLGIKDAGQIDRKLLGGIKTTKCNVFGIPELDSALNEIIQYDEKHNGDRYKSVLSFYNDYERSISAVANSVKSGGTVVYVVGNRRVRNVELQTDVITYKLFEKYGFSHEKTYVRDILNKRMPSKASPADREGGQIQTMTHEYIVIMHKN